MTINFYAERLAKWGVKVLDQPFDEQMTLDEAKLHLRVDDDIGSGSPPSHPDDELIAVLISSAREWCEAYTGLSLAPKTLEIGGSQFTPSYWYWNWCEPCLFYGREMNAYVELPFGPLQWIVSVTYIDADGNTQTIPDTDYLVDDYGLVPRLYTSFGGTWPTPRLQPNAAKIRYVAGFDLVAGSPIINPLPASILAAMKLVLGHLYENREQTAIVANMLEIPLGAAALLDSFRVRTGIA